MTIYTTAAKRERLVAPRPELISVSAEAAASSDNRRCRSSRRHDFGSIGHQLATIRPWRYPYRIATTSPATRCLGGFQGRSRLHRWNHAILAEEDGGPLQRAVGLTLGRNEYDGTWLDLVLARRHE